ncbi:hypothetical protein [Carboxylicivirga sp. N1Y90]|uniref:hypothetical protein n=1 Tax=Carboxylicivirga fragile TaxID=3417571 RepID=UPI003D3351BF|nr:hypothetical protein [Marinilabiliaceae bacterium N1Y90]
MKKLIFSLTFILCAGLLHAQESDNDVQTLFSGKGGEKSNGGYGAVMVGYSNIADRDAILIGGRGAWIIDHNFAIGMGGYGFITDPKTDPFILNDGQPQKYQITGGYGGLLFEPIIGAKKPIHLSFPILIGAGGVAYTKHWENTDWENSDHDYQNTYEDSDAFFVVEPGVEVEFNMLKFFRIALSASYRYTSNINLDYKNPGIGEPTRIGEKDMLRGMNYGIALKFGKF